MDDIIENIKAIFNRGGMFLKLLYINVAIFVLLNVFMAGLMQFDVLNRFSFDSIFIDNLTKPWSIITYMFIHANFRHILFNMLILFFIGGIFEQLLGAKKVLSTYVVGGLCGAILFIVTQNIFPLFINTGAATLLGASASVMALFVGLAAYRPNMEMALFGLFKVKLFVLALIYVGLDLLRVGDIDGIAHFAHLGGAAWGCFMGSQLRQGKDISNWFDKNIERVLSVFKSKPKMKVTYSNKKQSKPPRNDYDYNAQKQTNQQKLDAILDKIKVGGYETLSQSEKDFLANY